MKPNHSPKLVRLKRYETPPEGYFAGFLVEFHRRQRADLLSRSSRSLFFERLNTYFTDLGSQKWAYVPALSLILFGFYGIFSVIGEPSVPSMPAYVDAAADLPIDGDKISRASFSGDFDSLVEPGSLDQTLFDGSQSRLISPDDLPLPEDY